MEIISAVSRKEVITVFSIIYNKFVKEQKCESCFDTLEYLDLLNVDKEDVFKLTKALEKGLISFSIINDRSYSVFSYVEVGSKFEINYKFNKEFIKTCNLNELDVDYNTLSSLSDEKVIEFYLALKTNEKGFFTIEGLKDIFDCHYRFSDDKDFIHNVVRPAIKEICKHTDLIITNFKKVRNKEIYTFHKEERVYMKIEE